MKLDQSVFDTSSLEEEEKFELYRQNIGGVFNIEIEKEKIKKLDANLKSYFLDEVILVDCSTIGQVFYRDKKKIICDELDHFIVQIFLSGQTIGLDSHHGKGGTEDSLFFIDMERPWKAYNPDFRNLSLIIPRSLLDQRITGINQLHGFSFPINQNPYAKLFKDFILGIFRDINFFEKESAHILSKNSIELLLSALQFHNPQKFKTNQKLNLLGIKVKEYIKSNICDTGLTIQDIASAFNISRANLYRIFPEEDGGINQFIKNRRLNLAYKKLLYESGHKQISQIAYECGFTRNTTFSRAFKEKFGVSPNTITISGQSSPQREKEFERYLWHEWLKQTPLKGMNSD